MIRLSALCALIAALPLTAAEPYVVDRADVAQIVRERGALEAASAVDIVAPTGGSKEKPLVIKWLVEDGAHVKKGERVIEFDSAGLRDQMAAEQIHVERANGMFLAAERDIKIARLTSERELRAATSAVELAELVAKNSTEANEIAKKRIELKIRAAQLAIDKVKANPAKGDDATFAVQTAELEREAATLELKQFELTTGPAQKQAELRIRDARDELELAKLRAEQRTTQAEANAQASKVALVQQKTRLETTARELQSCVVMAPADGMVLYETSRQTNRGPVIAVGEPVRAGQIVLRIPDLRQMKVETRIHEAVVSQLRPGQIATVRVDAVPNQQFEGRVQSISPTASPPDFRNRDVKVYPASIGLPQVDLPLKPGMSAEVQIITGIAKNALRVPVGAVVRTARKSAVAVDAPGGVRETSVVTGVSDGKFIEIREGLKEGDKVLMPTK